VTIIIIAYGIYYYYRVYMPQQASIAVANMVIASPLTTRSLQPGCTFVNQGPQYTPDVKAGVYYGNIVCLTNNIQKITHAIMVCNPSDITNQAYWYFFVSPSNLASTQTTTIPSVYMNTPTTLATHSAVLSPVDNVPVSSTSTINNIPSNALLTPATPAPIVYTATPDLSTLTPFLSYATNAVNETAPTLGGYANQGVNNNVTFLNTPGCTRTFTPYDGNGLLYGQLVCPNQANQTFSIPARSTTPAQNCTLTYAPYLDGKPSIIASQTCPNITGYYNFDVPLNITPAVSTTERYIRKMRHQANAGKA
jgi:hypothetical protein